MFDWLINWVNGLIGAVWDGITGWVSDLVGSVWDAITDLYDSIAYQIELFGEYLYDQLAACRDWVGGQLTAFMSWWRVIKYRFRQAVSKWMSNPWAFWLTVATIAVLVAKFPEIMTWLKGTQAWITITNMFKMIKDAIGTFLYKIGYIAAMQVHRILLILNPDYQNFWSSLDSVFMAMAEEIEIGVGTINALTMSVRNLYFSVYTMLGVDVDTIEMKFYDDATKFWQKANDTWEKYVANPQLIFLDIQKELIYPILRQQADLGIERAQRDLEVARQIEENIKNLNEVRKAVNDLIKNLPDFMQEYFNKFTAGWLTRINLFFDEWLQPILDRVDRALSLLEEDYKDMRSAILINMMREAPPGEQFINLLFDGSLNINEKRLKMSLLLQKIVAPDNTSLIDNDTRVVSLSPRHAKDKPTPEEPPKTPPSVKLFELDYSGIVASAEDWFVGEY